LWGSLLLGASILWPMSYGYDEPQHIDMAYVYAADPFHFHGPGTLLPTRADLHMQASVPGYPPQQPFATAPTVGRSQRPSFDQLGGHAPTTGTQPNQMVQHPPLYYWLAAVILRLPGVSHLAWDVQVWLMRLLSVLMLLPVPALCWAGTRRLLGAIGPARVHASDTAMTAAVIPLTIPNLIRDGSSVTNDSLLILSTSVLLYLLIRVITGDLTRRTAAGVGVSLAAALLTKGFALVLPPVVLAAYLLGAHRSDVDGPERYRRLWRPLGIAAVGGIVGGLWWVRNLVNYGTVQVNGFGPGYDVKLYGPPDDHGTLAGFLPRFLTDFARRIWGGTGLPDTPSAGSFVVFGWFALAAIALVAGIARRNRAAPADRLGALVLLATPVLTFLLVAADSYSTFRTWSDEPRAAQGRYLYHAIVALAVLIAIGWMRLVPPRWRPWLAPTALAAAIATNAVVWLLLLRDWYQPVPGGLSDAVHGVLRWSPLPMPLTVVFVAVLPAMLSVASCIIIVTTRRTGGLSGPYGPRPARRGAELVPQAGEIPVGATGD
jgi:4-amino-4-deoxy-L-arabinose transferase-like glycosyltransferase